MFVTTPRVFSVSTQTALGFEECLSQLRRELLRAGFRILVEVPFHQEFERHVGLPWPRYTVLVVWSPSMAYQAVLSDPDAGIFMPFHVFVEDKGHFTHVAAMDHLLFGRMIGTLGAQIVARNLTERIREIFSNLAVHEKPATNLSA